MRHVFVIEDREHEAWLSGQGEGYALHFDERAVPVTLAPTEGAEQRLSVGAESSTVLVATDGDLVHVHIDGTTFTLRYLDPVQRYGSHASGGADDIAEAPMPGVAIAIHVAEGQRVMPGDTLIVIESMKLETAIKAWREGAVAAVHVAVGQAFQRGAPLLTLAPLAGA
jgi:biotin carboxyl carrier protein